MDYLKKYSSVYLVNIVYNLYYLVIAFNIIVIGAVLF